jgi:hypothetical protein
MIMVVREEHIMNLRILLSGLIVVTPLAAQPVPRPRDCHYFGETVTITGGFVHFRNDITSWIHFQSFSPFHPFSVCSCPPQGILFSSCELQGEPPGYIMPEGSVQNLPLNIYLEVTGKLGLRNSNSTTTLTVTSFRNVDAEIESMIAAWKRECTQWQDRNIDPHQGRLLPEWSVSLPLDELSGMTLGKLGATCSVETVMNVPTGTNIVTKWRSIEEDKKAWTLAVPHHVLGEEFQFHGEPQSAGGRR